MQGPFRDVWDRLNDGERERLGEICSFEISNCKFTLQRFEKGLMYWLGQPDESRNIWVLYSPEGDFMRGAAWQRYEDTWPGDNEHSCDEELIVRGFGWLWCNNEYVRECVGNPVGHEAGSGDDPPYSHAQFFQGGAMFFRPRLEDPLNTTNQVLVLFDDGDWRRLDC
jgi:hypothetical protein